MFSTPDASSTIAETRSLLSAHANEGDTNEMLGVNPRYLQSDVELDPAYCLHQAPLP